MSEEGPNDTKVERLQKRLKRWETAMKPVLQDLDYVHLCCYCGCPYYEDDPVVEYCKVCDFAWCSMCVKDEEKHVCETKIKF